MGSPASDISPAEATSIVSVPTEVLLSISEHCSHRTALKLAKTCKGFYRSLLSKVYELDMRDEFESLAFACYSGRVDCLEKIFEALHEKADQVVKHRFFTNVLNLDIAQHTPLVVAIRAGSLECVQLLVHQGADLSAPCDGWPGEFEAWPPLIWAINARSCRDIRQDNTSASVPILECLLVAGAQPDGKSSQAQDSSVSINKTTSLCACVENTTGNKTARMVKLLLKHGADPTKTSTRWSQFKQTDISYTPLSSLVDKQGRETWLSDSALKAARLLVAAGAGRETQTVTGEDIIIEILQVRRPYVPIGGFDNWTELLRILLEGGVDPNTRSTSGRPALMELVHAHCGDWQPRYFGFDPAAADYQDIQQAYQTCNALAQAKMRLLVDKGADINATALGKTALHMAAGMHQDHEGIFEALLLLGANPGATSATNQTPLFSVRRCDRDRESRVSKLVRSGCPLNVTDDEGETALHVLARSLRGRHDDLLEELISLGAKPAYYNHAGETARDIHLSFFSDVEVPLLRRKWKEMVNRARTHCVRNRKSVAQSLLPRGPKVADSNRGHVKNREDKKGHRKKPLVDDISGIATSSAKSAL